MARGVSSASPGIPFLQVPWPFLMLSQVDVIPSTQVGPWCYHTTHHFLLSSFPSGFASYKWRNLTFSINVEVYERLPDCWKDSLKLVGQSLWIVWFSAFCLYCVFFWTVYLFYGIYKCYKCCSLFWTVSFKSGIFSKRGPSQRWLFSKQGPSRSMVLLEEGSFSMCSPSRSRVLLEAGPFSKRSFFGMGFSKWGLFKAKSFLKQGSFESRDLLEAGFFWKQGPSGRGPFSKRGFLGMWFFWKQGPSRCGVLERRSSRKQKSSEFFSDGSFEVPLSALSANLKTRNGAE